MSTANDRVRMLLGTLDTAWMEFQESYAGLGDEQMREPGVTGDWSVRDLIPHVTWWDAEALKHLPLVLDGGRLPRYSIAYGGIDAFNALMTERKARLSLDEVRREFAETHRRLVEVETIDRNQIAETASETPRGDRKFFHELIPHLRLWVP